MRGDTPTPTPTQIGPDVTMCPRGKGRVGLLNLVVDMYTKYTIGICQLIF